MHTSYATSSRNKPRTYQHLVYAATAMLQGCAADWLCAVLFGLLRHVGRGNVAAATLAAAPHFLRSSGRWEV